MLRRLRSLWRNLRHRERVDWELDEELESVRALLIDEKIRSGMAPEAARRAAILQLGQAHILKEYVRDARTGALWDGFVQDVRATCSPPGISYSPSTSRRSGSHSWPGAISATRIAAVLNR